MPMSVTAVVGMGGGGGGYAIAVAAPASCDGRGDADGDRPDRGLSPRDDALAREVGGESEPAAPACWLPLFRTLLPCVPNDVPATPYEGAVVAAAVLFVFGFGSVGV